RRGPRPRQAGVDRRGARLHRLYALGNAATGAARPVGVDPAAGASVDVLERRTRRGTGGPAAVPEVVQENPEPVEDGLRRGEDGSSGCGCALPTGRRGRQAGREEESAEEKGASQSEGEPGAVDAVGHRKLP